MKTHSRTFMVPLTLLASACLTASIKTKCNSNWQDEYRHWILRQESGNSFSSKLKPANATLIIKQYTLPICWIVSSSSLNWNKTCVQAEQLFFFFKHRHLYVFQMKLLVDFFSHKMLICTKIFLGMKSMWFCPPCEYRWNHKFSTLRYFFIAFIWITKDLFAVTFLSRGSACSKVRKMI